MILQTVTRSVLVPVARAVFRPVVEGRHHVPRTGSVILAANHLSVMDSFVIPLLAPRPVAFLAKAEYFEGLGLSGYLLERAMTAVDAVPVPRGQHRAARAALDTALGVLQQGRAFGIHPEGSRSRDGRLYRGRTGVAWLALASGAPVVPVGLVGTDRVQPVGARLPRPARITVRFGEPLRFDPAAGPVAKARREITDTIMAAIRDLTGQEEAGEYNALSMNSPDGMP
jgi:1-acyl-sn-glycerol-3-phosphate acyltransferase